MQIQVDHIGIAVSSLQESLALYTTTLGLQVSSTEHILSQGVSVAMLSSEDSPEAAKLELLEAADEASVVGRFMIQQGPGLHHLALRVDNLEEAVIQLRATGLKILGEPQQGAAESRFVFVHPRSTGGVLLELVERKSL